MVFLIDTIDFYVLSESMLNCNDKNNGFSLRVALKLHNRYFAAILRLKLVKNFCDYLN